MKHSSEHSDQPSDHQQWEYPILRRAAKPTLAAGAHKQELRRSLMQEIRVGTDPGSAGHGALALPWLPRLGYAIAAVLVIGLIAAMVYLPRDQRVARDSKSTTRGFTAAIGTNNAGGGISVPTSDDPQIDRAIEKGQFRLDQTIRAGFGGRVYLYRVRLDNGGETLFGSDHVIPQDPVMHLPYSQQLEQSIEKQEGRFDGVRSNDTLAAGTKLYRYRLDLSNGTSHVYLSDRDPDSKRRQIHESELSEIMSRVRGELVRSVRGPNQSVLYLVKTTLSDGTPVVYASSAAPKAK